MKKITDLTCAQDLWQITGDFETPTAPVCEEDGKYISKTDAFSISMTRDTDELGVTLQKSTFKNTSQNALCLDSFLSKFIFNGGEYEVYTQFNGWQNESRGAWQPLVSSVTAECSKLRFSDGAAPFIAIWNKQTNRGTAFHLLANSAWQMCVRKEFLPGEKAQIEVEIGLNRRNLLLNVEPEQWVELPEIIYYEIKNKTDLDCYKLHNYCNNRFPEWKMAVIYNTWLYKFEDINYENVQKQITPAADIGAEYFVIDAGWFGNEKSTNWCYARGDWEESLTFGFKGRMNEIADEVRKKGMKFGIWLEPELASATSNAVERYPDFFIKENNLYFLDFTNPDAVDYIFDAVCKVIDKYDVEFIKFDYNASLYNDPKHESFISYCQGYNSFLQRVRAKYPNIYLSACGSGGMQTNLSLCNNYDGIWFSDNQSVYDGKRIFKDTILRMPPQMIEKWVAVTSLSDFEPPFYRSKEKILSTDDATWARAIDVHETYLKAFMQGTPIGLSCDLTLLSEVTHNGIKETIAEYKEQRDFLRKAVCRLLTDTESMTVFQYGDLESTRAKIVIFADRIYQDSIDVFPVLCEDFSYEVNGEILSGTEIMKNGINVPLEINYRGTILDIKKV